MPSAPGRLNETNRDFRLSIIGMETVEMARARVRLTLVDVVLKRVV
ncbi:MAG: hypothetical protein HY842_02630 [Bacteroidetes bacterium]|nr:hypothetical protein [Bacteroidota bacterium]